MLVFINDKEGVATGKFLKTIIRKFKLDTLHKNILSQQN